MANLPEPPAWVQEAALRSRHSRDPGDPVGRGGKQRVVV
jgi:hypothetical protein